MTAAFEANCEPICECYSCRRKFQDQECCGQILREWKVAVGSGAGHGILVIEPRAFSEMHQSPVFRCQ